MTELLETTMLICFGASWPISVVKNIRSKTAKSMSLPFILLIIAGYIAGISAKVISGNTSFVLAAYIINLLFVSANIPIYLRNKSADRKAERQNSEMGTMKIVKDSRYDEIIKTYESMNKLASKYGVVFFGSNMLSRLHTEELANSFHISDMLYNRSVRGMKISDAPSLVDACILDLSPQKVFIEIGSEDMQDENFDINDFITQYEWLLYTVHTKTKAKIYIVSSIGGSKRAKDISDRLIGLSKNYGCDYIDITRSVNGSQPELKVFDQLKFYIRSERINFYDAMRNVTV